MTNDKLGEIWNPAKCRIVLAYEETQIPTLSVHIDPARAGVWRDEPFYSQLKRWAVAAASSRGQVIVRQGRKAIVVLPDGEKDLGEIGPDQFIVTTETVGPSGTTRDAVAVDADDPWFLALKEKRKPSSN
jgi:hypothetical protein